MGDAGTTALMLDPGSSFPDLVLPDHAGRERSLSELSAGDPLLLSTYRGFWCPKEQAFFRRLVALQDEADVDRVHLDALELREHTDTVNHPYRPAVFVLDGELRIEAAYNGYWYWGRPGVDELRRDLRDVTRRTRADWLPER